MPDQYKGPFGGYATPTAMTPADQTRVDAMLGQLQALIPDPATTTGAVAATYAPDFDQIPPATAAKLHVEITAMRAAVMAAPTASHGT